MNRVRGALPASFAPVVVSVLLTGCASPAPTPTIEAEPTVEAAPTLEAVPTVEAGESLVPSMSMATDEPIALDDIAWVFTPPPSTLGGPDGSYTLQAGTLASDEPIVDLEIPWQADLGAGPARQPAIGAPHGGSLVYVADDGAGSEIRRVKIAGGGGAEVLATLTHVVWDIVVAPDGSTAYAAIVGRADTTRDLGVVRILLDGSGSVEHLVPPAPLGAAGDVRRVAVLAFQVHLAISSDGEHLVRRTCAEAGSCLVQVIELATGRSVDLPDLEVLGVAGGAIVTRRCGVDACRLEAMNVETGAILSAGIDLFGQVVEVGNDPVVIGVLPDATGRIMVEAVDPASGRRSVLYQAADDADVIFGDFLDLHMDLPAGFVHVVEMSPMGDGGAADGMDLRHLLISVVEGRAIEIPPPAYRPPPGFFQQG